LREDETMARKRVADIAAEEQAQFEEAQRCEAVAVEEEPKAELTEEEYQEYLAADPGPLPFPVGSTVPETGDDPDPNEKHVEDTYRTARRPFDATEHEAWEKQHVRATLLVRDLEQQKKDTNKRLNDRIKVQQDEAITAAEKLEDGHNSRSVKCDCVWDLPTRTYYEMTQDTREVVHSRPLTAAEIERFLQGTLPGHEPARWLSEDAAVAKAPEVAETPAEPVEDDGDGADDDNDDD
jgi:hypothetical protein